MILQAKVFVLKTGDLSSITGSHVVEGDNRFLNCPLTIDT